MTSAATVPTTAKTVFEPRAEEKEAIKKAFDVFVTKQFGGPFTILMNIAECDLIENKEENTFNLRPDSYPANLALFVTQTYGAIYPNRKIFCTTGQRLCAGSFQSDMRRMAKNFDLVITIF